MKKFIIALLSIIITQYQFYVNSEALKLPVKEISSIDFYIYEVQSKDATLFGISKEIGVDENDILKYNPDIDGKLIKGQRIFLPVNDFLINENKNSINLQNNHSFFKHKVKSGETLYGISKLYNIGQDIIILNNPNSKDGIKAGEELIIPQDINSQKRMTNKDQIIYHTIVKGNTLFNISNRYNTSIEEIISLNPGVSPDNFKIGDVIKIRPNTKTQEKENTNVKFVNYKILNNDSFEDIANKFNISAIIIKETNDINKLPKKGKLISIPIFDNLCEQDNYDIERAHGIEIYDSINNISQSNEVNVALFLPFMLNENIKKKNNQSKLYCEFYKGFLLAVDSLRHTTDKKIKIVAFDTKNSVDTITKLLNNNSLTGIDLIIGPNEKDQLNIVSEYCIKNNINLVNPFIIRSEDYNHNDHFFHVNIPNTYMHNKLIDYYDELFQYWNPVFLSSNNNESKDIAVTIKEEIQKRGKKHLDISFDKVLEYHVLDSLLEANEKYIFIPMNSSRPMIRKIAPALKELKDKRIDLDFALFGYPEWTSYNFEYEKTFKELNTYVYSRFFLDEDNSEYKIFLDKYERWYGDKLINAIPSFGPLGYELGFYFISNLIVNERLDKGLSTYDGFQTPFNFKRVSNWSGHINWAICFIHYATNKIERMVR